MFLAIGLITIGCAVLLIILGIATGAPVTIVISCVIELPIGIYFVYKHYKSVKQQTEEEKAKEEKRKQKIIDILAKIIIVIVVIAVIAVIAVIIISAVTSSSSYDKKLHSAIDHANSGQFDKMDDKEWDALGDLFDFMD